MREWAIAEVGPGRLLPWFAVAFGAGIVLYFTAECEPALWEPLSLPLAGAIAAFLLRRRPVGFVLSLGLFAIAAGFATATLKAALIEHTVLRYPAYGVSLAGFVELREESQKTDRFVLRVQRIEAARIADKPQRVRLSVRRGMAPPAGAFIETKAQLNPPLPPLRPGSYDFARDLYFQRIGASGFAHGAVRIVDPPVAPSMRMRANAFIQGPRDAIDARIRSLLAGDVGAIASALITGKRDGITPHLYDAMFVSGIGHVLSISGYHMAVVAGVVFFFFRALLALMPGVSDRMPIKKRAAFAALLVTAFYLVLSGAEVATQRSFIMIAIVLIGVMLDRPILTLRTVTIAALLVLSLAPEAVVHPSFQMSFAATLALVAAYSRGLPWTRPKADTSLGARGAVGRQRDRRPHSRFARRRARHHALRPLPLPSRRALRRARQPARHARRLRLGDADGPDRSRRHAVRIGSRILAANGSRHRVDACDRALGGGPARGVRPRQFVRRRPAVAGDGGPLGARSFQDAAALERRRADAVRHHLGGARAGPGHSGCRRRPHVRAARGRRPARLPSFHHSGGDTFAIHEWLAADSDGRDVRDPGLGRGISCDPSGCVGKLADGRLVAYAQAADAFEEDCRRATVVVATREAPRECAATVIDRSLWRTRGALAIFREGASFTIESARPTTFDRPLGPRPSRTTAAASSDTTRGQPAKPAPAPRDATPRSEDLQPDD